MASKMVIDREKSAEAVAALSRAQTESLAAVLSEQLGLTGPVPLVDLLQRWSEALLAARQDMVRCDEAHEAELADDPAARDARDDAARTLTASLVELREIVTGVYGREAADAVFPQSAPSDPVALVRFTGEVVQGLQRVNCGDSRS